MSYQDPGHNTLRKGNTKVTIVLGALLIAATTYELGLARGRQERAFHEYTATMAQYEQIAKQYADLKTQYDRIEAQDSELKAEYDALKTQYDQIHAERGRIR